MHINMNRAACLSVISVPSYDAITGLQDGLGPFGLSTLLVVLFREREEGVPRQSLKRRCQSNLTSCRDKSIVKAKVPIESDKLQRQARAVASMPCSREIIKGDVTDGLSEYSCTECTPDRCF